MGSIRVLDIKVDDVDRAAIENLIVSSARDGNAKLLAYANIHAANIARGDPRFRDIINRSALTYCDGEGVRLGARLLGKRLPPRTVLTSWVWDLCRVMEQHGLSVYLLGGRETVVAKAVSVLQQRYPTLRIVGQHHGFFAKSGEESQSVVNDINKARPDVLFVCFGMPLQEYWIDEHQSSLRAGVILPAGSMIDYVAGEKSPPPAWMANHGLEWAYRLAREPRRLWRRYLIGNPLFLVRILGQRLRFGRV